MFEKLKAWFSSAPGDKGPSWFSRQRVLLVRLAFTVLISYVLANIVSSILLPRMTDTFSKGPKASEQGNISISLPRAINYHDIKKVVISRNVFNRDGDVPKEEDENQERAKGAFDMDAPCEKTALKVKLVGLISLSRESASIAMIKEEGMESADAYNVGDYVIGADSAQIVAVRENQVVINNAGRKECLDLKLGDEKLTASYKAAQSHQQAAVEESSVELDAKFVQSELGEGFGKIIQAARLVPNIVDNQVNGFKIFGIQPGSVLEKAGFKENDVIIKVNNTPMEIEHGFALYQALNDEKVIRVSVLRNGLTPKTLVIRVK